MPPILSGSVRKDSRFLLLAKSHKEMRMRWALLSVLREEGKQGTDTTAILEERLGGTKVYSQSSIAPTYSLPCTLYGSPSPPTSSSP